MKTLTVLIGILLLSCAPKGIRLTEAQLNDTAGVTHSTFDTLAAYRKMPGGPKTVTVQGYYRSDSTYVPAHTRTARRTKAEMHGRDTNVVTISQ